MDHHHHHHHHHHHSTTNENTTHSSSSNDSTNNKDNHQLKQLNKLSHKISKPTSKKPSFEIEQQPPQQQPPVYNINKNDFRQLVQQLTGSPTTTQQQPQTQTKPQSSRLHRIRPPPLAHVSNRPSPLLPCAPAPFSPLPPFPGVDAAAESPVTAYLRRFVGSRADVGSGLAPRGVLVSPRWGSSVGVQSQLVNPSQGVAGSAAGTAGLQAEFQFPSSPLAFGCLSSPSGQLGFPQLPLSPTVPSPK